MPDTIDILEVQALGLAPAERARLAERLLASLDADPKVEEAWMDEALRREAEVASGKVALVPGHEALGRIRARLP